MSFDSLHDVVSVDHVQKFARKNRDYHRVYRAGVVGLEAEEAVKKCKSHRCALDTDYNFITEELRPTTCSKEGGWSAVVLWIRSRGED